MVEKLLMADVRERLKKIKAEKLENGGPKLNALIAQMAKARETLLEELKALADAEPTEVIHSGLLKSATEARKLLIDKITRGLSEVTDAPEFSDAALASFDERLTRVTNLTTDAMVAHGRYVGSVFGSRFSSVRLYLRELHDIFRQAHTTIADITHESKSLDPILAEMESLVETVQNTGKMQEKIKSLEEQTKEAEETLKSERARLNQLESSEEFKRATDSVWEVNQTKLEINRVEGEVIGAFSEISRPLRKLGNLVASGKHQMDRDLIKALDLCIESPLETIVSDEKVSATETLLKETSRLLSEHKIDLEERERRKKLERTQQLAAALGDYKKRLELLNKQLEVQTQVSKHSVLKQVTELKHSISQNETRLNQTKTLTEEIDQKLKQTKNDIEKKRAELERSVSETLGLKVEITF